MVRVRILMVYVYVTQVNSVYPVLKDPKSRSLPLSSLLQHVEPSRTIELTFTRSRPQITVKGNGNRILTSFSHSLFYYIFRRTKDFYFGKSRQDGRDFTW